MKQYFKTLTGQARQRTMNAENRFVDVGGVAYCAEFQFDPAALQYLANKAALSKKGKAQAGPIFVTITKREIMP